MHQAYFDEGGFWGLIGLFEEKKDFFDIGQAFFNGFIIMAGQVIIDGLIPVMLEVIIAFSNVFQLIEAIEMRGIVEVITRVFSDDVLILGQAAACLNVLEGLIA